jgi:predicted nucleotide-binding protein
MEKTKKFPYTYFQSEIIKKGIEKIISEKADRCVYKIGKGNETLKFDDEREFYSDYRKSPDNATIRISDKKQDVSVDISYTKGLHTSITVEANTRGDLEEVFEIFEENDKNSIESSEQPKKKPFIFIGHGRSPQWRDLKDHLVDKHGYQIEAYETGSREGHTIRDILEEMSNKSSLALLLMTGEDLKEDGTVTARPNVIHEVGLFQGKLGFSKAIVLLEEGTEEFSNLYGIQQIRFSKDNIKETFGDVIAIIKRELEK